ncbi:MAG: CoA activase [Planctomycetes bacterium]|nr:CoA activase [Planctomycetota bacterium]
MKPKYYLGLDAGSISLNVVLLDQGKTLIEESYTRIKGRPVQTAKRVLSTLFDRYPIADIETVAATGSGGRLIARLLGIEFINEIVAQARAEEELHPEVRTIIEIGGEDSKLIWLEKDPDSGRVVVRDFAMNTVCAAGTGSFLDQQASRLGLSIEKEFGELAIKSENPPRVAGRCSVFAKSDMIHLQQQATPDYDIVAGLCYAMARNVKSNLATGKEIEKPVAFQGGVAANQGLVRAFEDVLELGRGNLIVPKHHASMGAIGAILTALDQGARSRITDLSAFDRHIEDMAKQKIGQRLAPLAFEGDTSDRHYVSVPAERAAAHPHDGLIPAYLGIDVGSISTNVVVLDANRNLLAKSYLMTAGRPLQAVQQGLREVGEKVAEKVRILGVCTTGSGRYLTGDFVGADCVRNEITAQATGAILIDPKVDTIFEIGGQDSKYISIDNGVVVDFEMNHVCAAGTGSFLEEQAERLGIHIKEEFGDLAFKCESPVKLGERCTVFMESNLVHCQQNGAAVDELVSGLSYSIVYNYLNRVVAHRRRGNRIFFQGGTAANKGVVAAFEKVMGKPVIVPEHHDVTGAIGAAILAQEYQQAEGRTESTFRGFDLSDRKYTIRPFECEDCPNHCEIKEVTIEGEAPLYYGSRCDKYNLKKEKKHEDIPDLFKEREKLLLDGYKPPKKDARRKVVGIPRALFMHQQFPYWHAFFKALGLDVLLSPVSNKSLIRTGVETVVSETCFPCKVMHGHVVHLLEKDVDFLFVPSLINLHREADEQENNYVCPYVQTIPYTLQSAIEFKNYDTVLLKPVLYFERGEKAIYKALCTMTEVLGVTRRHIRDAMAAGRLAQDRFERRIGERGKETLASISEGQQAMVVLSRPYNGCDAGINLRLPHKLRDLGVLAIPMDFLPLHELDNYEEWENMFWKYGQNILRAAEIVKRDKRLNAVYISNFGCGPDSFISSFVKAVLEDQPLLQLEIDEHSADAGVITRCEAYLDSVKNVEPKAAKSVNVIPKTFSNGDSRTLMIPQMGLHAFALAAAFRGCGMNAEVIPMSDAESLEYGRRYTLGKECLPCIVTTGDMLKIVDRPDFDPNKVAFFMPSGTGPCRFGQYCNLHRLILKRAGFPDVPVIAPNQGRSFYDDFKQLKKDPTRLTWQGIVSVDVLHKALHATRPYEKVSGTTDRVFRECLDEVCGILESGGNVFEAMHKFAKRFTAIDADYGEPRPVIGIVGEIYVRSHSFCNQDIVRRLEALGAEVKLASTSEWIYYTNFCRARRGWIEGDYRTALFSMIKDFFQKRDEKRAARPFLDAYDDVLEVKTRTLLDLSNPYIHDTYEGEAVLSIGKTVELFHQNAHGVVNVLPFTCMPGTVVSAVLKRLRRECSGFPTLSIAYDGQEQANLETRLEAFVHQCRQYMENMARKGAH